MIRTCDTKLIACLALLNRKYLNKQIKIFKFQLNRLVHEKSSNPRETVPKLFHVSICKYRDLAKQLTSTYIYNFSSTGE